MTTHSDTELLQDTVIENKTNEVKVRDLILYNDDYNTFEFVIESLVEICDHDSLQAEQCTYIVHYNGKCSVKNGTYDDLNPMRVALCDRGLSAVVE
ncbi:MAG: ATP-dependent Clp protease adaptor ClpS [Bacteroidetes bacterium]|nr:ATP-dependent Clp protease adaptor ClpS [Bacteroidota bacterium]